VAFDQNGLAFYNSAGTLLAAKARRAASAFRTEPTTGLASDAAFSILLGGGAYTLALTQYDNFALGDLSAGFSRAGSGNFTPTLTGTCNATAFCDSVGAARTAHWAINVSAVPEPSTVALMLAGLAAATGLHRRRKHRAA
jgi:hypothetical protein